MFYTRISVEILCFSLFFIKGPDPISISISRMHEDKRVLTLQKHRQKKICSSTLAEFPTEKQTGHSCPSQPPHPKKKVKIKIKKNRATKSSSNDNHFQQQKVFGSGSSCSNPVDHEAQHSRFQFALPY